MAGYSPHAKISAVHIIVSEESADFYTSNDSRCMNSALYRYVVYLGFHNAPSFLLACAIASRAWIQVCTLDEIQIWETSCLCVKPPLWLSP